MSNYTKYDNEIKLGDIFWPFLICMVILITVVVLWVKPVDDKWDAQHKQCTAQGHVWYAPPRAVPVCVDKILNGTGK